MNYVPISSNHKLVVRFKTFSIVLLHGTCRCTKFLQIILQIGACTLNTEIQGRISDRETCLNDPKSISIMKGDQHNEVLLRVAYIQKNPKYPELNREGKAFWKFIRKRNKNCIEKITSTVSVPYESG